MSKRDFLFELGTEELPPRSLFTLARALSDGIVAGLQGAAIEHGAARWFATPRRLAVHVARLADSQPDQQIRRFGPALAAAFDAQGRPSKAALGFAASCGVNLEALSRTDGPKGEVLAYVTTRTGEATTALLPGIVNAALRALPIARRMRWGAGEQEFVRPVHWAVMLFGGQVVEGEILGLRTGRRSRGHRFHGPAELTITSPGRYTDVLLRKGSVMVDAAQRRECIRSQVAELARSLGGEALIEADLLDEVTALVEWPVPLAGRFDERYLELPAEVLIATLQMHQRYFPVCDAQGRLLNAFIAVANIRSRDPDMVRNGNERVIRPRLADAAFFWNADRRVRLEQRCEALKNVTYQAELGSLYDRSARIAALCERIAEPLGANSMLARRAALLSKCDLLTAMVGEFPELQGVMGRHYAQHDGEEPELCIAMEEQYWPRFAGDRVPATGIGQILSIADRLDTLAGIFGTGQKPSGSRDPFGLRRASLGVLRILLECKLDLDLRQAIDDAVALQPVQPAPELAGDIWLYLMERLRSIFLEDHSSRAITSEMFAAVLGANPRSPLDIGLRLGALEKFLALPQAGSLAGTNKRIANILRKAPVDIGDAVDGKYLQDAAERQLFDHMVLMEQAVRPLLAQREYAQALALLASLHEDVDRFFDAVMVMAQEPEIRANRLKLLIRLRKLFLQVVDLSCLPG